MTTEKKRKMSNDRNDDDVSENDNSNIPYRYSYRIPVWRVVRRVTAAILCASLRRRLSLFGPCALLLIVCREKLQTAKTQIEKLFEKCRKFIHIMAPFSAYSRKI